IRGDGNRFVRGDGLDGDAGCDVAEERQLDGPAAVARRHHLDRPAAIPGALDEAFFLQVREVLVYRGERREAEAASDLLEARRVAVLPDELGEVIENLALPFGERKHKHAPSAAQVMQKKGESQTVEV